MGDVKVATIGGGVGNGNGVGVITDVGVGANSPVANESARDNEIVAELAVAPSADDTATTPPPTDISMPRTNMDPTEPSVATGIASADAERDAPAGGVGVDVAVEETHAQCNGNGNSNSNSNSVATTDALMLPNAAQDESVKRNRPNKRKTKVPKRVHTTKATVANGKLTTLENEVVQLEGESTPSDPIIEVIDMEAEGDTESDSLAVAPVPVPSSDVDVNPETTDHTSDVKKRSPSFEAVLKDDDELAGVTSVEDPHSPDVICLDSDDKDDEEIVEAEEELKEQVCEAGDVTGPGRGSHRRKKRARAQGFATHRTRKDHTLKRRSLSIVADETAGNPSDIKTPVRMRARRQQSGESIHDGALSAVQPASSSDAITWNWDACRVYYEPLSQANMDELATVRRECARVVAANRHMWGVIRRLEHDDAYLASLATDVNEDDGHMRIRPLRRGRSFRDVWEEEDFVANQQRPSRTGKKRPFAGCEIITSNRELVRGYDDELFRSFMQRLENRMRQQSSRNGEVTKGAGTLSQRIQEPPARRLKIVKRRPTETDKDTLPAVPAHQLHPASSGAWKLKGKDPPSFDVLHPAAVRSITTSQRWVEEFAREQVKSDDVSSSSLRRSGRHEPKAGEDIGVGNQREEEEEAEAKLGVDESGSDEVVPLPSFGVVIEDDEVAREITNSLMRLVEVSALNWRRTQTLYERAVSHIEVAPLLQAEEAAAQRLEHLYRTLYPSPLDPDNQDLESGRELKFRRRPRDLLSYLTRSSTVAAESVALRGSVEFALRLKRGDPIDVLDRNGCWNDGVVVDIYSDAGGDTKNVLVSFALWGAESTEWVPVIEARILPRGVADGRVSFTLAPSRTRKRYVELNKQVADLLQRTYPTRQNSSLQMTLNGVETNGDSEVTKLSSSKKQRRR